MPKRIVVVEDESNDLRVVDSVISRLGDSIKVEVFRDGLSALDFFMRYKASKDPVALTLVDLSIPRIHGVELINELKKNPETKSVPIVVFSGTGSPVNIKHAYQFGANGYVTKPTEADKHSAVLEKVLDYWLNVNELPAGGSRNDG